MHRKKSGEKGSKKQGRCLQSAAAFFVTFLTMLFENAVACYVFTTQNRSSHRTCSIKKGDLRNFAKFTGKHLCQSPFFNKVAGLRPATLLKKRLWHRCFTLNFAKFLRTPSLQNTSGRLLRAKVKYMKIHATSANYFTKSRSFETVFSKKRPHYWTRRTYHVVIWENYFSLFFVRYNLFIYRLCLPLT